MTDPFSVTASVISITAPALHGIRLLLHDLEQIKDAPKSINRLLEDVRSVEATLRLLQGIESREWDLLGVGVANESKATISNCTHSCLAFRSELQQWTRHTGDGKLALRDRAKVGFFKRDQLKAISTQLRNAKLSINLIVSIAKLYSSVRHSQMTEEVKNTMITKQEEMKEAITDTNRHLIVLGNKLNDLECSSDEDDNDVNGDEGAKVKEDQAQRIRQLEETVRTLQSSLNLLEELLRKAQEEAIAKATEKSDDSSTKMTFGNHNSGFQSGVIHGGVSGITFG